MWLYVTLSGLWLLCVAAGLWMRLGLWLWACKRFQHQDPVRLWLMAFDRPLPPPPAWYVEEGKRYSLPPPDAGL